MIVLLLSILSSFPVLAFNLESYIFVSEHTAPDLVSEFVSLSNTSYGLRIVQFSHHILPGLRESRPHLIFDYTSSLSYRHSLRNFAIQHKVLYFSREDSLEYLHKWVFFLHPPPSAEAQAIQDFLNYLEVPDYHLASSESSRSKAIYSFLTSAPYNLLSNSVDQENFDHYVSRGVKPTGNWKLVYLGEHIGASKMLSSLEKSLIYKERCVFVVNSKGLKGTRKLGAVGIVEESLEDSESEGEYEFKAILRAIHLLKTITQDLKGSFVSNEILAKRLKENTRNNIISDTFSIANFRVKVKVAGKISRGEISIFDEIVFPGNVTYINNSPPKVVISADLGSVEFDGQVFSGVFQANFGLRPMTHLINNDPTVLPTYQLELHETDCGSYLFEYNYTSKCMQKHFDRIGVTYLASLNETTVLNYRDLFKENNIEIPHITISYTNATFYNKELFPDILINMPYPLYFYVILPYILRSFRWENIILLYNPHTDPSYASAFIDNAKILQMNILNDKDHRYIPYRKTENYYEEVKHILQFVYESKCRIIVLLAEPNSHCYFIEALHKFGFRRGELVLIFLTPVSYILQLPEGYDIDRDKVLELVDGSLAISFDEYVGDYGQKLQKQIASFIHPFSTIYTCYRIDSFMLAVRTIDLMINIGRNYENFDDIMHFMRGIWFTGCSGKVAIDSAGNGLRDAVYTIHNFYKSDGEEIENRVGTYTMGVTVPIKISKAIVWPNGQTEVPGDMFIEPECGFPLDLISSNGPSREISAIITSLLFFLIFVTTAVICCLLKKKKIELLQERKEMMFEDGVLLYSPLIEAAQFIALGPDFHRSNFILAFVCSALCLELEHVSDFDDFWMLEKLLLMVSSLWCCCLLMFLTEKAQRLPAFVRDFLEVFGLKFVQVFSGVGFIGINVILFKLFNCKDGVGKEATDSFLYNDCTTSCWTGYHLIYIVIACLVLLCFNFFAICARPVYDRLMDYVNVKIFPFYSFAKGIFALALVLLNLHLKIEYPLTYSAVYCVLILSWTLLLFRIKCYNYERLNSWVRIFSSGVCAHQILMVGYTALGIPDLAVLFLQIAILVVCAGTGFYFQVKKFPSMLFRRKGRNFEKLLKFTFTRKVLPKELTLHQLDYVIRDNRYIVE